ncbi:MAG: cation diffusion facilitator family transporter, partial [Sulfurovum sp.]
MKTKKILLIIFFNLAIIVSEIIFGLVSNSFALIADALHNTGDVLAIVITYIALRFGTTSPTFHYTFGFIKAEMMAAFTNTLFLLLTMLYMIYESIGRFFAPEVIAPEYMIIVGMIAVIANGISAYLLHAIGVEDHHENDHHQYHGDAN